MTCIVGIANGKNVWMGADSCASDEVGHVTTNQPKIFIKQVPILDENLGWSSEPLLVGGTGMFRGQQLIEFGLTIPTFDSKQTVLSWLVVEFADALRELFKQKGFAENKDGVESFDGTFLVGMRGELYEIEESFQAVSVAQNEYAAGSGAYIALASLHTSRKLNTGNISEKDRIRLALEAACALNLFCKSPLVYLDI